MRSWSLELSSTVFALFRTAFSHVTSHEILPYNLVEKKSNCGFSFKTNRQGGELNTGAPLLPLPIPEWRGIGTEQLL